MQYNVDFEITSLIFVLFIFIFSCIYYPIKSKRNQLFRIMALVLVLTELVDIITALMINYSAAVPKSINIVANSLYFAGGTILCYMFGAYTDLYFIAENGRPLFRKTKQVVLVFIEICIIVNMFNGMLFYFDENKQYVHGPGYYMLYGGTFFFIFVSMLSTALNFKIMTSTHRTFMCLFFVVFLTPTILQMLVYTDTLLVLSGASLGLLFNFFFLETPDYVKLSETLNELNAVQEKLEQNNEQLMKEKERADQASRAKTVFLANMSHEIRTPINAVLGMDTMILREAKDEQILRYAHDIQNAGRNLLSLINDILDFTKIESGKMEPIYADYEFAQVIEDIEKMIRPRTEMKGLEFEIDVDERIASRFWGDDFRLKQILTNLLTNAVKYTPKGKIILAVEKVEPEAEEGQNTAARSNNRATETLRFSVSDTGIGVKTEDIEKLTDIFVRVDESKNRNIEGTGLGINIVVRILEMYGSKLEVQSTYGEGSVFSFLFKQEITCGEPIGKLENRMGKTQIIEEYAALFCAPDAKLLVVDDNAMNRNVFLGLVKELQCEVDEAESGMRCLELVQEKKYDLIFMDHLMPIMDGVETLHQMKALDDYPNADTPVVILTANAVIGARKEYLAEGFDEYLTKPVNADDLEKLIGHLLPADKKRNLVKTVEKIPEKDEDIELPMMDGVDFAGALLKLQKKKILMQAITGFSKTAKVELNTLSELYEKLREEPGAIEDFRIKVHAMKSTAALIGANHVSGLAKYVEYAAKENDLDTIQSLMPVLAKEWIKLKDAIDQAFGLEEPNEAAADAEEKAILDGAELKQCLGFLTEAMDSLDVDRADAIMEELNQYQYDEKQHKLLEQLAAFVINLDKRSCQLTIEEWLALL